MARKEGFLASGILYFANNSLVKILAFVFTYFASNYLGSANFGVLTLALSITLLAASIGVGGFQVAAQKMLHVDNKTEENQIISLLWISTLVVSTICFGGIQLLLPYIDIFFGQIAVYDILMILCFGIIFVGTSQLIIGVFKAKGKPKFVFIIEVCNALSAVVIILVSMFLQWDLYTLAIWLLIRDICTCIISVCLLASIDFKFSKISTLPYKRKIFRFSFHMFIINIGYFFVFNTGRYLGGMLLTPHELGIYSLTLSLGILFLLTQAAFSSVFKPLASKLYTTHDLQSIGHYYRLFNCISANFNGILMMIYLGFSHYVLLLFGNDFTTHNAQTTLILIAGGAYIYTWTGLSNGLLQMTEQQKKELIITGIGLLANIILGYILGLHFGLIGIAIATSFSLTLRILLQILYISKNYAFKILHPSQIRALCIVLFSSCIVIFFRYNIWISIGIAVPCILYFLFQLLLLLKNYKSELLAFTR